MFGPLGVQELIFILVIALLIFGPKRLPEIGRTLGKAFTEFRRASEELKRTIHSEISTLDAETRAAVDLKGAGLPGLKAPLATQARGALTSALGLDGVEQELREEISAIPREARQLASEAGLGGPGSLNLELADFGAPEKEAGFSVDPVRQAAAEIDASPSAISEPKPGPKPNTEPNSMTIPASAAPVAT